MTPARLIVSLLFVLWPDPSPAADPAAMPHVDVLVRNWSAAPAEIVQKAEASCQQIFRHAGIRITWINRLDDINWQGPDIVLRAVILPNAPASRAMGAFGTALRDRQELLLFHDRVRRASKVTDLPAELVLSVALVHEIGHLLLDSDEHTLSGVMRAEWGKGDFIDVRQGQFRFTPDQSRRMKANVQGRGAATAR